MQESTAETVRRIFPHTLVLTDDEAMAIYYKARSFAEKQEGALSYYTATEVGRIKKEMQAATRTA